MIQIINSLSEVLKERSRNPFFATLILVWFVRNWELVYTLFNFDSDCKLIDKVQFVKNYYYSRSLLIELFSNIGLAFSLMIIGFILLIITKVIANIVNQRIIPTLNDRTVKGLTVNRSLYEQVKKQGLNLQNDLDMVSKRLIETEVSNSQLKSEKSDLELQQISLASELQKFKNQNNDFEKKIELWEAIRGSQQSELWKNKLLIAQLTDKEIIIEFLQREGRSKNVGIPKIIRTYRKLITENLLSGFSSVAKCTLSDDLTTILNQKEFDFFHEMELISFRDIDKKSDSGISSRDLKLEPLGYSLYNNLEILVKTTQ